MPDPDWSRWLEQYSPPPESADRDVEAGAEGLSKAEWRRLPAQDELDLHGFRGEEALGRLEAFVKTARAQGLVKLRVVHGRGLHSPQEAVLKPRLRSWLSAQAGLSWENAPRDQGGDGATLIWLKRPRSRTK